MKRFAKASKHYFLVILPPPPSASLTAPATANIRKQMCEEGDGNRRRQRNARETAKEGTEKTNRKTIEVRKAAKAGAEYQTFNCSS